MTIRRRTGTRVSCAAAAFALGLFACGSDGTPALNKGGAPAAVAPDYGGLRGQHVACPGGATTTVSGVVYAPNGRLPLYNRISSIWRRASRARPPLRDRPRSSSRRA
jgi:hypothetical protein